MTTSHPPDEQDIRQRVDVLVEAVRNRDLDTIKTVFAPELVSYDIQPPLQHLGAEAKWRNWTDVFATYQTIGYQVHDLSVLVDGDLAVVHSLNQIDGTLGNGARNQYWLRWTACFRRQDGDWLIAHDHVSVPTEFPSGRSVLDLEP
ncbi:YybH family protein [Kribbella sp. CA-247076]|uniref:YybH family protein n=1 Tax=Kribbella sp. CA-247076 TaxID=3239941 RepID=UPI003D8E6F5C